jgi:hypothetical protein
LFVQYPVKHSFLLCDIVYGKNYVSLAQHVIPVLNLQGQHVSAENCLAVIRSDIHK